MEQVHLVYVSLVDRIPPNEMTLWQGMAVVHFFQQNIFNCFQLRNSLAKNNNNAIIVDKLGKGNIKLMKNQDTSDAKGAEIIRVDSVVSILNHNQIGYLRFSSSVFKTVAAGSNINLEHLIPKYLFNNNMI